VFVFNFIKLRVLKGQGAFGEEGVVSHGGSSNGGGESQGLRQGYDKR
jgi:hypothetical protein